MRDFIDFDVSSVGHRSAGSRMSTLHPAPGNHAEESVTYPGSHHVDANNHMTQMKTNRSNSKFSVQDPSLKSTHSETVKKAEGFPKAVLKKIAKNIGNFLKFIGPSYSKDFKAQIVAVRVNTNNSAKTVAKDVQKVRYVDLKNTLDATFG
ncbi:MAG: hypothetical protein EON54_24860 [Alcaligenaceae bacterium]|nr:MAG: hypothetical protein EON54_24860 [Alcaligenaceae bacterium]